MRPIAWNPPIKTKMPNDPADRGPEQAPLIKRKRGLSPVWILPIVAALLGIWLVGRYYAGRGPEVTVRFETADGVIAGKTPVLCRSVNVGIISGVQLTDDLKGVIVTLQMTSEAKRLLRKDTQIWIVRPRYGAGGISGLSTLVSGTYVALEPGVAEETKEHFVGLEQPPVTPRGVPGLHLRLMANNAGGLDPGSPIIYKGLSAGKLETRTFHPETGQVEFGAFIQAEFAHLVRPQTKFWNVSGIDLQIGSGGVQVRTGTLEALLIGGITFSEPKPNEKSEPVSDGSLFNLYDSFGDAQKLVLRMPLPYLLLFTESVRGLQADAPVEFRGIPVGRVEGISFKYLPDDPKHRVPVLIKIDPSLIAPLSETDRVGAQKFMADNVAQGLRATLKSGSLLTGQQYIDLDFQKDAKPDSVIDVNDYKVLPTYPSQFQQLQEKAVALVDKAGETLASVQKTLQNVDKTVSGFNEQSTLYQNLSQTLRQLDETLQAFRSLSETIERKPNSLIFGKPGSVPPPKGKRP